MRHRSPNPLRNLTIRAALWGRRGSIREQALVGILFVTMALPANAGDILRGGTLSRAPGRTGNVGGSVGSGAAARTQSNARDRLARTNQALDAMRALQQAARASANAGRPATAPLPRVPDGLRPGGLQVANGVPKNLRKPQKGEIPGLWIGADLPTESRGDGGAQVTIKQTEQQALLNWKTFNIGEKTTLTFDQSAGGNDRSKWVAFNKVNDPRGRPSQILGSIRADGQVYVINQNGIIFGGTSQVNVHALVASALPINANLISRGLLNNIDAQFLFDSKRLDGLTEAILANQRAELSQIIDPRNPPRISATIETTGTGGTTTSEIVLTPGRHYQLETDANRRTTVVLTKAGLKKVQGAGIKLVSMTAGYFALTGDVTVEKGARIVSPTSAAKVGGRVQLVGANVRNSGTISTPDGQTILSAGLQVGLNAHAASDPSLRGLDVFVGAVADENAPEKIYAGTAVNDGIIEIPRGNATMAGRSVQQNGAIDGTTSVSLNGRIDLDASYDYVPNPLYDSNGSTDKLKTLFVPQSTGIVTLGEGSITRILPELTSNEKATGTELAIRSQINARGLAVHFEKDAQLLAPNAIVNVDAGKWNFIPGSGTNLPPSAAFMYSTGQIYAESGVMIDVSGTTAVDVPLDQNILTLEFRGAEFADSPLQRDGLFRNTTITIDARRSGVFNGKEWIGTPLGDATGFLDLLERGVGQMTVRGGEVNLRAGESVVLREGSTIDVSGGWLNNKGGLVRTTKVLQGGQLIGIADATPDQIYDRIYDPTSTHVHSKWGITKTYRHALNLDGAHFESDYVQGANAGSIAITAASVALDGKLAGNTVIGPRQVRKNELLTTLPEGGKLSITFRADDPDPVYEIPVEDPPYPQISPYGPQIVFGNGGPALPLPFEFALNADGTPRAFEGTSDDVLNPFKLRGKRRKEVVLSPDLLTTSGFSSLTVDNATGDISLPANVALTTPIGGAVTLKGRNIDIQGSITAPGGALSFTAYNLSPYLVDQYKKRNPDVIVPPLFAEPDAGRFALGPNAVLNTAGLTLDERIPTLRPIGLSGGKVDVTAMDVRLAAGSLIDVSGGVLVAPDGSVSYGDAGSIALRAGRDPTVGALFDPSIENDPNPEYLLPGRLLMKGELRGYSGAKGGSLALQAPFIQVGEGGKAQPGTLRLTPDFFNCGGFTSFDLAGIGGAVTNLLKEREHLPGLVIAAGTVIAPRAISLFANPHSLATGHELVVDRLVQPLGVRTPVSLAFRSLGLNDDLNGTGQIIRGDLVMGDGAAIRTDPLAEVAFTGSTVAILGTVDAPAGKITVQGSKNSITTYDQNPATAEALTTVYLGSKSRLSTRGTTVLVEDSSGLGRRLGSVLPGGSISVEGNIAAVGGSVLDVSGTSGVLDFSPLVLNAAASREISPRSGLNAPLANRQFVPVRLDSDGGSINLEGGEQLFSDATLLGRAGGAAARGGLLTVSSGRFSVDGVLPTDPNLVVTQDRQAIPLAPLPSIFQRGEQTLIGKPIVRADGSNVRALGYFAADTFERGGFDSLALEGAVRFHGPVSISARGSIKVATGGVLYADDRVNLNASYVALGLPFRNPLQPEESQAPFGEGTKFGPTHGPGILTVSADLIDIGTLSLRNIGRANFFADNGDIRGEGTLHMAGHLRFRAGQIYTPTALSFTAIAYDYKPSDYKPGDALLPGSVVIRGSGSRPLPLSAGGTLSIYASEIQQDGVLRAPLGTINLGWDGTGEAPVDLIAGDSRKFPVTQTLTLGQGSITSVSAVDPATGAGVLIPYGVSMDGNSWIDPAGRDITLGGAPQKAVNLGATRLVTENGSQIDLRGGGDLYAYRWSEGNLGSRDLLASEGSFAVIPDYGAGYAPYAPFSTSTIAATNLSRDPLDETTRDPGYVNRQLSVGDRVFLGEGSGLAPGTYTLLPARYALLPGAYLVTPTTNSPIGPLTLPDGTALVSGYRDNAFGSPTEKPSVFSQFQVLSAAMVRDRASYEDFTANRFLSESAIAANAKPQPLPYDAGHLVFQATEQMRLDGIVRGQAATGGRAAFIDVSSTADILIAGNGKPNLTPEQREHTIVLNSARLSSWGAESLLVGGIRTETDDGIVIDVQTGNLTVDNAGSALSGSEILLAADKTLTLANNAKIIQSGDLHGAAQRLTIDGNGTFLRVSGDPEARFARTNVTDATDVKMTVGAGAWLEGGSITLDSSRATDLSARAVLRGRSVNLQSGQISLVLDDAPDLQPTDGLVLAGRALGSLHGAESLSLLSYSSIDLYGHGEVGAASLANLALHAGEIRGFTGGGRATLRADHVLVDNSARAKSPGAVSGSSGQLAVRAQVIEFGDGAVRIDQFKNVDLSATGAVYLNGKGRLLADAELDIETPSFFAAGGVTSMIRATGNLEVRNPSTSVATNLSSGLGASLTLQGANVVVNSDVLLPSGLLTLRATKGDVDVNGHLDVGGTAQRFNDIVRYSSGGEIKLVADRGSVNLGRKGALDVAADNGGGDAGTVSISATGANGNFTLAGNLFGSSSRGEGGNFALDVRSLPELAGLSARLNDASFTGSRNFRVREGDVLVNGVSRSSSFRLSADRGSILVRGTVDVSGDTGGSIAMIASGSLMLADGATLDASGKNFSNAGKGGDISLEAGAQVDGVIDSTAVLDLQRGSKIDLSVAAARPDSAAYGRFTGTLHLRAPQNAAGTDLQMAAIDSRIVGASSIVVEGYKLYDLTGTNGNLSGATLTNLKNSVMANGNIFVGTKGTASATYGAMHDRLLGGNSGLDDIVSIVPGAEIIHRTGDITLGTTTTSNANDDWNFAGFRFGEKSAPGVLTMSAAGNLVFNNALHDGFNIPTTGTVTVAQAYTAGLLDANALLPMNAQSWSYRLTAGADFAGSDFRVVRPLASLAPDTGSLKLGRNVPLTEYTAGNQNLTILQRLTGIKTSTGVPVTNRYQVIRTGSGSIDISTGRDVQLLNQFATIYTAGTKVADATLGGAFDVPVTYLGEQGSSLGVIQQDPGYPAQFTLGGGNVTLRAQGDIAHLTRLTSNPNDPLVADSQRQLPINWLYRRGFVDPSTGRWGATPQRLSPTGGLDGGDVTSTSWWVDFSNFFEGVGALGGGDVTLIAGRNVSNVDAVAPTNARMPKTASRADQMVELGGGDVTVRAGNDIDAGVYYVERGVGTLVAGNQIKTNATRSPDISVFNSSLPPSEIPSEQAWLPTTLFLGKGRFDVSARGDVLLGPTANPFLLPEGLNNSIWYKTWFSTYAPTSAVNVTSMGGNVTLRTEALLPVIGRQSLLQAWLRKQLVFNSADANSISTRTAAYYHPWLRLNETSVAAYSTVTRLLPPILRATAFTGDLNLVGTFNLTPSSRGNVEFVAGGAINGLQPYGVEVSTGVSRVAWTTSLINLSDATPSVIPGIVDPYAYRAFIGPQGDFDFAARLTVPGYLVFLDQLFEETGSLNTTVETRQKLHAAGPLHRNDPDPVRLYAGTGDISGLTLFSPKAARIVAGQDIIDNAFYIQNLASSDVSIVSAGRNLIPYSSASPLRTLANAPGNLPPGSSIEPDPPLAGDIQVAGPGTLVALAGGALDLGTGATNADGTGSGIVTVGNARNPYLPFEGASIVAGAGIGPAAGLADSSLDFDGFIDQFLLGKSGGDYLAEVLPDLTVADFQKLPTERRNAIALQAFYLVLRDAGRRATETLASGETAGYALGFAAIDALFPGLSEGSRISRGADINTRARDIRTKNGGDISIFAPRGELTLATSVIGNPLVPPGVITEAGGDISIFADGDVDIGIGRIFTLRGGDMIIWSSNGNIAAGAASRTVKSAPPTRVLIDPTSGDVQTDLAGLATGGGIGVLATVAGVAPGDVDLIAPNGVVDAGDAGIRVSGNLNIAATAVLNAENISVKGTTTGVPTAPVVAAPNIAGLVSASNVTGATSNAANEVARQARTQAETEEAPSDITVEVLGYGGSEDSASL